MDLALSDRQLEMREELRTALADATGPGAPLSFATETLTDLVVVAEELGVPRWPRRSRTQWSRAGSCCAPSTNRST